MHLWRVLRAHRSVVQRSDEELLQADPVISGPELGALPGGRRTAPVLLLGRPLLTIASAHGPILVERSDIDSQARLPRHPRFANELAKPRRRLGPAAGMPAMQHSC